LRGLRKEERGSNFGTIERGCLGMRMENKRDAGRDLAGKLFEGPSIRIENPAKSFVSAKPTRTRGIL
jgi:hypothetical protein